MTQTRMTTRLPQHLADALAARAKENHRSINGELCAILEAALSGTPGRAEQYAYPSCNADVGQMHITACAIDKGSHLNVTRHPWVKHL